MQSMKPINHTELALLTLPEMRRQSAINCVNKPAPIDMEACAQDDTSNKLPSVAFNTPTSVANYSTPIVTSKSLPSLQKNIAPTEPSIVNNTNALFQPEPTINRAYQPHTLIIADDTSNKLKIMWHTLNRITFNALNLHNDSESSPFKNMNDETWSTHPAVTKKIGHLTFIYVANGDLAYNSIINVLLDPTTEVSLITDQNMPNEKSLLGTQLIDKIMAIKSIPIALNTSDEKHKPIIVEAMSKHHALTYINKNDPMAISAFIQQHCFQTAIQVTHAETVGDVKPAFTSI